MLRPCCNTLQLLLQHCRREADGIYSQYVKQRGCCVVPRHGAARHPAVFGPVRVVVRVVVVRVRAALVAMVTLSDFESERISAEGVCV